MEGIIVVDAGWWMGQFRFAGMGGLEVNGQAKVLELRTSSLDA